MESCGPIFDLRGMGGGLQIWDLREGHICYTLQGARGPINAVAFSSEVLHLLASAFRNPEP